MNASLRIRSVATALLIAIGISGVTHAQTDADKRAKIAAPRLTKAAIQHTNPTLSAPAFEAKWKDSLDTPLIFIRSYPAAYHESLKEAPAPIGAETLCLGDAHPANFGWLDLGGKASFVFNDLDDSGYCPVAYDALRYFIALQMLFDDKELTKEIIERYVDVVKDGARASSVPNEFLPKWDKIAQKELAKSTSGDKLAGDEMGAAVVTDKSDILGAISKDQRLSGWKVLDVAEVKHEEGGSGGLRRLWLLVEKQGRRTILELKEEARPGVEWGRHKKTLNRADRLPTLKQAFWKTAAPDDWFELSLGTQHFVVRDRLRKKSLDVEKLSGGDRKDILQAQASEMAKVHAAAWSGVKKDDIRAWLLNNLKALGAVWKDAYASAKKAEK